MSHVRSGVLIAIIVFAAFAAYAFLSPATYRTSALLLVDTVGPAGSASTLEPLEAARRLSESVLDRATLDKLSRERAASTAPEVVAQAASGVRQGLQIDTSDARSFSIGYQDTNAERTQRACNELARRALTLAPQVILDRSAAWASELKRQDQTQALAAFLAAHPQVASEAPPSGDKSPDKDPAISAFNAEKANLEHRIGQLESGTGSDNPYVDPRESNLPLLKRRLIEINTGLSARREALSATPSASPLSPDLRAEWKALLDAVTQSTSKDDAQVQPGLSARLVNEAPLPASPIDPNRRRLLFFGVVFGVGFGMLFSLSARAGQQRRPKSSRPPVNVPAESPMQVPAAPAVPSALGPQVPVTPPSSNRAPPIVPIPQRPISSNPAPDPLAPGDARPASSRSPRRFASTLVLPPAENPSPLEARAADPPPAVQAPPALDPILASANQAWEQQIRAHDVPGFAVVKPGSEPPPPEDSRPVIDTHLASSTPPRAPAPRTARPPNQMKVTQPLGSFVAEAFSHERSGSADMPHSAEPSSDSRYSYVSSAPPTLGSIPVESALSPLQPLRSPSPPPRKNVVRVHPVQQGWRPDPSLTPQAQRGLSERLYAYAVENCFVIAVVSVPEAAGYKSRVAAELALSLAESGHPRILLLEGDLHRPAVQRLMNVDTPLTAGFSHQMNMRSHPTAEDAEWTVVGCTKSLHVLAEGMMRSPGLLLSRQFARCMSELRTYYDFIVIDGPVTSLEVDSGPLDAVTDGLVTVCPANGSPSLPHMQQLFGKKRFSAFATSP